MVKLIHHTAGAQEILGRHAVEPWMTAKIVRQLPLSPDQHENTRKPAVESPSRHIATMAAVKLKNTLLSA